MHLNDFIVAAVVFLTATALSVSVFKRAGLGGILGLLVAGVIIGPYTPGIQITDNVDVVLHFAELGVVMLLFLIGLEMKPATLWKMRREVFGLGSLQIIVTGLILVIVGYSLGVDWEGAWLMGMGLALSSTAFVMQMLKERGEIAAPHGQHSFSILLMQDLAVVPLLALVPILASTEAHTDSSTSVWISTAEVIAAIALVIGVGRWLVPKALYRLSKSGNREGFFLIVMLTLFFAIWVVQLAGLSMALGAFLMGMMLSGSAYHHQIEAVIEPFKGILMSLFFVSVGMSINIEALAKDWAWLLGAIVVVMGVKFMVIWFLAWVFRVSAVDRIRMSVLLCQSGEFAFVLFGAATVVGLISDRVFVMGVGLVSITMLLTPLLVRVTDHYVNRHTRRVQGEVEAAMPKLKSSANCSDKVIIGGYGRVGRILARMLDHACIPYLVLDRDVITVEHYRAIGVPIYFGDISDLDLLSAAKVDQARMMILTANDSDAVLKVMKVLRESFSYVPVVARARDRASAHELIRAGAVEAHPELMESSLVLGKSTLEALGVADEFLDQLLRDIRSGDYQLVDDPKPTK